MNTEVLTGLLPDHEIRRLALEHRLIEPFVDHLVRERVVSYGLGSAGYDVRLGDEFLVFTNTYPALVDPKQMDERAFVRQNGPEVIVPRNSFVLATTLEYLRMPEDILGIVLGKSTYARCGPIVNATPLEAGWEGTITLEISNTTPLPARLYAGEGIAQILFFRLAAHPEVTYADRRGVYQGQRGVTLPRVHAHAHGKYPANRIIAMRVEDLPAPWVPSRVDRCSTCGAQVWVSLRAPAGVEAVCTWCVPPEAIPSLELAPQTRKELLDLGFSVEQVDGALETVRKTLSRRKH